MNDGGINADHQVEIRDDRGGIHEGAGRFIQPLAEIQNRKIDLLDLLRPWPLVQADQTHAGDAGQRREKWARGIERQRSA